MSIYVLDPEKFCQLCYHHTWTPENRLYCPIKKCHIDLDLSVECANECEDLEINKDWLNIHRAVQIGKKYEKTGDMRVFYGH